MLNHARQETFDMMEILSMKIALKPDLKKVGNERLSNHYASYECTSECSCAGTRPLLIKKDFLHPGKHIVPCFDFKRG